MTRNFIGIEQLYEDINEQISTSDFDIFPSGISGTDGVAFWPESEGFNRFIELAKSLGKRILYVKAIYFTFDELIDLVMSYLSIDPEEHDYESVEGFFKSLGISSDLNVRKYQEYGKQFDGRIESISVEWVHDGIVHRFWSIADWYGFLLDSAGEISGLVQ